MRPSIVSSGFCTSAAKGAALTSGRTRSMKNAGSDENVSSPTPRGSFASSYRTRRQPGRLQRVGQRLGVRAATEGKELHEQPLVRALGLAILHAAFFADVRGLGSASRLGWCRHALIVAHSPPARRGPHCGSAKARTAGRLASRRPRGIIRRLGTRPVRSGSGRAPLGHFEITETREHALHHHRPLH